jgi:thiamine biosynthesis lipoprotein
MIERSINEGSFPAMSTVVQIIGVDVSSDDIREAERLGSDLADIWDRTFSRFQPDSELSRLNDRHGRPMATSQLLRDVLERALEGARLTGNRFDPTILPALEQAGYDRDIAEVRRGSCTRGPAPDAVLVNQPDSIEIDHAAGIVRIPSGIRIDLGGIAKGAFVDRLADAMHAWPGGCVDAGGDMRVWGIPPGGDHWIVGVEDPGQQEVDCAVLDVCWPKIAIATSGTNRRRWRIDGRDAHHIIDPATGQPLAGPLQSATAIARTAVSAEIASKAILVAAARGERIDGWGSDQSVVVTSSHTSGKPIVQVTAHSSIASEEHHAPPCIIHTSDSNECCA